MLFLLRFVARLPFGFLHGIGTVVGWLLYLFPNRERQTARVNISLCFPELAAPEQARLVRQSLIHTAKTMLEMPACWLGDREALIALIDDGDLDLRLQQRLAKGKGLIIAAPHLGNWELGVHWLSKQAPITILYRPPRQAWLEEVLIAGRRQGQATLVPTTRSGIRALYQALQRGEMIAILPDQQPKQEEGGVFAPFFGQQALSMMLLSRLAAKTGAPVAFMFASRQGKGFKAHWLDADPRVGDQDPQIAVTALNQGIEQCVRLEPKQYQWTYRRFSKRPAGERSPYKVS